MRFEVITITPAIADALLKNNCANRRISLKTVDLYARDMMNGKWEKDNPSPIVLSESGKLLDGQHRLLAVIRSGLPRELAVAYVRDGVTYFDAQRPRTISQWFEMSEKNDKAHSHHGVALVRMHITRKRRHEGNIKESLVISRNEIDEYITENADNIEKALLLVNTAKSAAVARHTAMVHAVYCALLCGIPERVLADFCKIVNTGFSNSPADYTAVLSRDELISNVNWKCSSDTVWEESGIFEEYIRQYAIGKERTRKITKPTFCFTKEVFNKDK